MIVKNLTIGTTEKIESTFIDLSGKPLNGDSPTLIIRRLSDNYYYDFVNSEFIAVIDTLPAYCKVTMTGLSSSVEPGKYQYALFLDPREGAFGSPNSYHIRATSTQALNSPMEGEVKTQYVSFDEAVNTLEEMEVIKATTDIVERGVERGMPSIIKKKISDYFYLEITLWYDFEGGEIIRAVTEIKPRVFDAT